MYLLSHLINLMRPWWKKVLIFLQKNLTKSKLLNGNVIIYFDLLRLIKGWFKKMNFKMRHTLSMFPKEIHWHFCNSLSMPQFTLLDLLWNAIICTPPIMQSEPLTSTMRITLRKYHYISSNTMRTLWNTYASLKLIVQSGTCYTFIKSKAHGSKCARIGSTSDPSSGLWYKQSRMYCFL